MIVRRDRALGRAARAGRAPVSPLARRLSRVVAFEGVPGEELEQVAADAVPVSFAAGEAIFQAGEPAVALLITEAGDLMGERALLPGETHVIRLAAPRALDAVSVPSAAVLSLARRRPQVAERLVALVSQRLRQEAAESGTAAPADVASRLLGAVALTEAPGAAPPAFEVLPVYLAGGTLWTLRPAGEPSWLVDADPGRLPEEVVSAALRGAGYDAQIVHSTSWRHQAGRLVLTYVAILHGRAEPAGFETLRVERADLARGSATGAPQAIQVTQVVEHGLRHLSWLSRDDPVIRAELSPEWLEVVSSYTPEPFRAL